MPYGIANNVMYVSAVSMATIVFLCSLRIEGVIWKEGGGTRGVR